MLGLGGITRGSLESCCLHAVVGRCAPAAGWDALAGGQGVPAGGQDAPAADQGVPASGQGVPASGQGAGEHGACVDKVGVLAVPLLALWQGVGIRVHGGHAGDGLAGADFRAGGDVLGWKLLEGAWNRL